MKTATHSRNHGYFFVADHAATRLHGLRRTLREIYEATPLGIVLEVLRSFDTTPRADSGMDGGTRRPVDALPPR